jgi:signal transduction histidine kinase
MANKTVDSGEPVILPLRADQELETILDAWQTATDRLQSTHETLCHEVQRLTQELETKNRELARRNRLADLGQMASHVAHEVRNSIVPLKLYLSLLSRHTSEHPTMDGLVDKIASGMGNLETTVNDLLHFTSDREPALKTINIGMLVEEVLESIGPHLRDYEIKLDLADLESIEWTVDEGMLRRALVNLALNAVDAMSQGGTLWISTVRTARGLELEIADSGPGIPPELSGRLFDPFVTTKPTGTGLGLAIVERIAAAHGGVIEAQNCPEGGAAFTLCLPDIQQNARRAA